MYYVYYIWIYLLKAIYGKWQNTQKISNYQEESENEKAKSA